MHNLTIVLILITLNYFVLLCYRLCPLFKPYIEAIKKAKVEKSKTE